MKALLIIFSLLLILLIAGLWVGPGSYPDRWRIEDRKLVQEQANSAKSEEISKMQAELEDVASGKEALEERARSELGMTKKGETFFEVVMQPEPKKDSFDESKKPQAIPQETEKESPIDKKKIND